MSRFDVKLTWGPENEIRLISFPKVVPGSRRRHGVSAKASPGTASGTTMTAARSDALDRCSEKHGGQLPRKGYGGKCDPTQFTGVGKRTLKGFAAYMDEEHGGKGLFLTGTLPGDGKAVIETFSCYTGLIVERLTQWFRDNSDGPQYAWVWERQKRGALHLHCIVTGATEAEYAFIEKKWGGLWRRWLGECSRRSGINLFWNARKQRSNKRFTQADARRVTDGGAGRYLAKYMGKEARRYDTVRMGGQFPLRWWRVSSEVRLWIDQHTWTLESEETYVADLQESFETVASALREAGAKVHTWTNKVNSKLPALCVLLGPAGGLDVWTLIVEKLSEQHSKCQVAPRDYLDRVCDIFEGDYALEPAF
jgi:hypothetical protein